MNRKQMLIIAVFAGVFLGSLLLSPLLFDITDPFSRQRIASCLFYGLSAAVAAGVAQWLVGGTGKTK